MNRIAMQFSIVALAAALTPTPATAAVHTVAPGETLWSIAQADGLSPEALAAANGLPADAQVIADATLTIPAAGGSTGTVATGTPSGETTGMVAAPSAAQPVAGDGYLVQPGDSLSAIAARLGTTPGALASENGLAVDGVLLAGTSLRVSAAPVATVTASITGAEPVAASGPAATPGFVSGSQIAGVAATAGVPASLAQAIAWQESGFNNGVVSSANARGVMQIVPGTWSFVQDNLSDAPLDPTSALGNVQGGVLFLRYLLRATGGDAATAVAGYYQGLASVRREGMLPSTQRYVANVLALSRRFGGP